MASNPKSGNRSSFLARGIRPSFHTILGWIILASLGSLLAALLPGAFGDFRQSQQENAAYTRDCAGVSAAHPGSSANPCYIISPEMNFTMPDIGEGSNALYADLLKPLGLRSQRAEILGSFDSNHQPPSGKYPLQIWRDRITQIQINGHWMPTADNPRTHVGPALLLALALATIILWAAAIWMLVALVKGFSEMRRELAAGDSDEQAKPIFRSP